MQLETREDEYCKLQAHCVMDTDTVKRKREEIVEEIMATNPSIPGFRPGKAPFKVVKHRYSKLIDKNLKQALVAEAYDNVVYETKIKPIGYPSVQSAELYEDDFWCDLVFLKKPEFELGQYKGLEIPKPHTSENVDVVVEQEMQRLREQQADFAPYSDTDVIDMKDKVTMDVKLTVGEAVDNQEGMLYIVGSNSYPEFDEHILGLKAGEESKFTVTFPETAPEMYRGKTGTFEVKIHMGMKTIPCPLDDSLAERCGYKSYDTLREAVLAAVSNRMENQQRNETAQQVAKRILANHPFEVPVWLIDAEAKNMCQQMQTSMDKLPEEARTTLKNQAADNVKYTLILDSIREAEPDINYSEVELLDLLKKKIVEAGQANPEQMIQQYQKSNQLYGIIAGMRHQMVVDWLVNNAKMVE